jgi:hypothetical protein
MAIETIIYESKDFSVSQVNFPGQTRVYFTYLDEENDLGSVRGPLTRNQVWQICTMIERAYMWGKAAGYQDINNHIKTITQTL